jgi:hypothetical protein
MDAVVDVGGPDAGRKQQQLVRQEVHGNVHERPAVGDGLRTVPSHWCSDVP